MRIRFLGHASFIIEDEVTIAIDPYQLKQDEKVDYIFITHDHFDHCSPDDIRRLADPDRTTIICPPDSAGKCRSLGKKLITTAPGKDYETGIKFSTVAAYNIGKPFHPKQNNWVGYIIKLTESVYHCGDTDFIPEMKGLEPDVFLVPIGGKYTMDAKEAAEAVTAVNPGRVIPMHYGSIVGSAADALKFKTMVNLPVEILEAE